jgi:hypothetical protein
MNESAGKSVTLPKLTAFLHKDGWKETSGKKRLKFSTGQSFESAEDVPYQIYEKEIQGLGEAVRIVLPLSRDGSVRAAYLADAVRTLSSVYERSLERMAVEIESTEIDSLIGIYPESSLSLARAHDILTHLKNLFAQAANAEDDPQPFLPDAKGNSITEDVNFGHTFAGSFGFRIECPVIGADRQMLIGQPAMRPMERRVLERLALGLLTVEESEARDDVGLVTANYQRGLNANVCDALIYLADASEGKLLTLQFSWSSFFPVSVELENKVLSFKLTLKKYALIKEASEALKLMVAPPQAVLVGTVVALASDVPPMQRGLLAHRKITILVAGGDHDGHKMQIEVSDADYNLALNAHTAGKVVQVEGTPKQRGSHWRVEGYRNFTVL